MMVSSRWVICLQKGRVWLVEIDDDCPFKLITSNTDVPGLRFLMPTTLVNEADLRSKVFPAFF